MSSLGFHRDSILNLASIAHEAQSSEEGDNGGGGQRDVFPKGVNDKNEDDCQIKFQEPELEVEVLSTASASTSSEYENSWGNNEFSDYDAVYDEYYDPYAVVGAGSGQKGKRSDGVFSCFIPWCGREKENETYSGSNLILESKPSLTASSDETAESVIVEESKTPSNINDKITVDETPMEKKVKGILKVHRCTSLDSSGNEFSTEKSSKKEPSDKRRSLFQSSYDSMPIYQDQTKKKHKVQFFPRAKIFTVTNIEDMQEDTKRAVWWQRSDFNDFKKTGRIIAKAMLTGGSEIWLNVDNSRSKKGKKPKKKANPEDSLTLSQEERDHYMRLLAEYESDDEEEQPQHGHKWWCKFGHSRRGLEHICNMAEGMLRQNIVSMTKKAVMLEQRRQKVCGMSDPDRIANISLHKTGWARDLSLATAAEDQSICQTMTRKKGKRRNFISKPNDNIENKRQSKVDAMAQALEKMHIEDQLDANTSTHVLAQHRKNPVIVRNNSNQSHVMKAASGYGVKAMDEVDNLLLIGAGGVKKSFERRAVMRN